MDLHSHNAKCSLGSTVFSCWIVFYSLHSAHRVSLNCVTQMKTDCWGKNYLDFIEGSYIWGSPYFTRQLGSSHIAGLPIPFENSPLSFGELLLSQYLEAELHHCPWNTRGSAHVPAPITGCGWLHTRLTMTFPWKWHSDAGWKKSPWLRSWLKEMMQTCS